jgi:predicted restriction endonuclease
VASHIKPWRASDNTERLDTYNGLLLLPNLDKAFDLGFITFTERGRIIVSNQLEESGKLGIDSGMRI